MNLSWMRSVLRAGCSAMVLLVAAQAAGAAELLLYDDDNYGGRSYRAMGPVQNLSPFDFNDVVSSVVVRSGNWQLCNDSEYRGQCIVLGPGSYPSLRPMGMNDRISSVRPVEGSNSTGNTGGSGGGWGGGWGGGNAAVVLYEQRDFGGRSLGTAGSNNLTSQEFNDRASSIVVRSGRWEVCSDADFRGRCIVLSPGSYGQLESLGLNNQISSLRPAGSAPAYPSPPPPPTAGTVAPYPPTGGSGNGWHGDDGSPPEVYVASDRAGRVTFRNGCVVYYNPAGQRFQNLQACHGPQIARADDAMARYRTEQGLNRPVNEHPWINSRPPAYGSNDHSPPEIVMGANRQMEVIFRNRCVAYYNAHGRRYSQQPDCDEGQLRRADQAVASYRREQGF